MRVWLLPQTRRVWLGRRAWIPSGELVSYAFLQEQTLGGEMKDLYTPPWNKGECYEPLPADETQPWNRGLRRLSAFIFVSTALVVFVAYVAFR